MRMRGEGGRDGSRKGERERGREGERKRGREGERKEETEGLVDRGDSKRCEIGRRCVLLCWF